MSIESNDFFDICAHYQALTDEEKEISSFKYLFDDE